MKNPFLHTRMAQRFSLSTYMKWSGPRFIAPFYHVVSNEPLPHIRHLYRGKSAAEFERDLDVLLTHYRPISVEDLPIHSQKENRFLLSFDDGLRQFYEIAAPILWRKGVPCICFLNSAFIDNQALFYRFKQSLLIDSQHRISKKRLPLPEKILQTGYKDQALLDEWAQEAGIDFEDFLQKERPYMTTEEIRSLAQKGFHFGGHSIDHPLYSEITPEEQIRQTLVSSAQAAKLGGEGTQYFSFPFTDYGVPARFFSALQAKVAYTFGTAGLKKDAVPNHLQRIPMEQGSLSAEEVLKNEYAYYLLKKPLFKNCINRK